MKKILKKIAILLVVTIIGIFPILNVKSYAVIDIDNKNLYSKGECERYLKFQGKAIKTTYVVYNDGKNEYPAYCLNVQLPGVGEVGEYAVSAKEKIIDVALWRVIINGYPYKTLNQLGVTTEEEAYTATKQAIYCTIYKRDASLYEANGEKGKNTYEALKQILENAKNETTVQVTNRVEIQTNCDKWQEDEINKKYVSKTYSIKADTTITNYQIIPDEKFPEGAIITDTSNNEKDTFKAEEEFKVLIPINSLKNEGNFSLNIETKINTKPVLYGKSSIEGYQDYALTAYSYEDAKGIYVEKYTKNQTKIKIIKKDKDTQELLNNVEFTVLDENFNQVYANLITNEKGEIIIENIIPGKYYIKETNGLQGYEELKDLLEINVNFNEELTVIVNNTKEEEPQEEKQNYEKVEFTPQIEKKLPITGM